jgi:hypothetical protein
MSIDYINSKDLKDSLNDFGQGNFFSLLKLVIKNSYDAYDIVHDQELILNLLSLKPLHQNQSDIVDLLIDNRVDVSHIFKPKDPNTISKTKKYWGIETDQELPYFLYLIPHLNDESVSKLLKQANFTLTENKKEIAEKLVIHFFNNGYSDSILALKSEYFLVSALERYENKHTILVRNEEKKVNLEELLFSTFLDNPNLLVPYAETFYNSVDHCADKWISHKLDEENKNIKQISKFIELNFNKLSEEGKERIIASTLYKTENLQLTKEALSKLNITKLKDYKPTEVPLWINSGSHKDKTIYKKLLNSGIKLFDYYSWGNKLFLSSISEDVPRKDIMSNLENQGIDRKELVHLFFEQNKTPGITTHNFSLLVAMLDSSFNDIVNISLEDLSLINKNFKKETYDKKSPTQKLELIDYYIKKTFLAPTYDGEQIYYRTSIIKKEINFNLWIDSEYNLNRNQTSVPHLIKEHLSILEQIDPSHSAYDFRKDYFKCIKQMFNYYSVQTIKEKTDFYNLYMQMIDYVSTDKSLPWNEVIENLNQNSTKKESLEEGSKILYNYLHKISLTNTFNNTSKTEKSKLKI